MTILTFSSPFDEAGGAASPQLRAADLAASAGRVSHAPSELAPMVAPVADLAAPGLAA